MSDDHRRDNPPRRRAVGALGMTAEELAELKRTGKWPERTVEPPRSTQWADLTLTSLPSDEYLRGYMAALRHPRPRGRPSEIQRCVATTMECLRETGGKIEDARKLYVERALERSFAERDTLSRQFSRAMKIIQTNSEQ